MPTFAGTWTESEVESYLGDADSRLARWLLSPDREEVRIRARPLRV